MSGHSKWSSIKRQKAATDAKRGHIFTKIANAITVAVREGGGVDPASNFKLRLTIDQARAANMPKDNIQRAIERGTGTFGGQAMETVVYEGYAPGRVALIIEAVTDNKNRTTPEIRGTLERAGGTFANVGAVSWMFKEQGLVTVKRESKTFDDIFEIAVNSGAEDVEDADGIVEVFTKPAEVEKVKNALQKQGLIVENAQLYKKPTTTVKINGEDAFKKVLGVIEKLEDLESVVKVYANFDINDKVVEKIKEG